MSDSDKYAFEINNFKKTFNPFRDKKIVLYGIGRYTATLLPHVKEYDIVGLLDRAEENIGLKIEGIPVISIEEAEQTADMIIINTTNIYWRMIYERIKGTSLPVYFLNGERAEESKKESLLNIEFTSEEKAKEEIRRHDIITFDFFDTLFVRQCFSLDDIFLLTERRVICEGLKAQGFAGIRHKAASELHGMNSTLDEIYDHIAEYGLYSVAELKRFKEMELSIQRDILIPRNDILGLLEYAGSMGKKVKIVSDMYLPSSFLQARIKESGVCFALDDIYVSCELKCRKADGSLWKKIIAEHAGDTILHFGDNPNGDVNVPRSLGISAVHVPNVRSIADKCGLTSDAGKITNLYESVLYALVIDRLFNNGLSQGSISDNRGMGYCVFGPLFLTYLLWLIKEKREHGYRKYYFFSRDGYFLIRDYEYLEDVLGVKRDDSRYLCVSRYVSMLTEAYKNNDFTNLIGMPYTGDPKRFLRKRFLLNKDLEILHDDNFDVEEKREAFENNKKDIKDIARRVSTNYLNYVKNMDITEDDALVDFSFRGSNQYYLCGILGLRLPGYYFFADKSEGNSFAASQEMIPCFQMESDKSASESNVRRNAIVIESLLTAPYGMIRQVYPDGNFECDEDKNNQLYFIDKEEINEGAKRFISDFIGIYGSERICDEISPLFVDCLYGSIMSGEIEIAKEVKKSFFYDNGMFHDMDNPIFE